MNCILSNSYESNRNMNRILFLYGISTGRNMNWILYLHMFSCEYMVCTEHTISTECIQKSELDTIQFIWIEQKYEMHTIFMYDFH